LALLALEEKLMPSSKVQKIFYLDLTELALMVLKREEARLKIEEAKLKTEEAKLKMDQ